MTFSIVGRAAGGDSYGVAVASKFLAVGAAVPAARAGVGALATQAWANLAYRPDGLALLAGGRSAAEVVAALTGGDSKRDERQLGVVDAGGGSASHTGPGCMDWAGHRNGPGYAIQGNILVGERVVAEMERAWLASPAGAPLARRLLAALEAGDAAGGDRRGRQSAALLVVSPGGGYGGGSDVLVDLRCDDHQSPVVELGRLLDLHGVYFGKPDQSDLLELTGELADDVRSRLSGLGYTNSDLETALADWAGVENLEERLVPGRLDPVVLRFLHDATP